MKSYFLNIISQPVYLFVSVWLILIFTLPIRGYYILNDSYVYVWGVENFLKYGFNLHPLVSPTLLFQTLIGGIAYYLFNSISVLKFISSFFYLVSIVYFYKFLQVLGINKLNATFSSLLLMFNPLIIYLGFTFMSDIYFLCFFIISFYYFSLFFKNHIISDLYLTSIALSLMFFSRQTGLVVFLVMLVLLYFKNRSLKETLVFAILPSISIFSYLFFFPKTLAYTDQSIILTIQGLTNPLFFKEVVYRLIYSLFYIGFFIFPFSVYYFFKELFPKKMSFSLKNNKDFLVFAVVFLLVFAIAILLWFKEKQLMFYLPNIISYAGFNPQNINDGIKQTIFVDSPVRVRAFYTLISISSLSVLLVYIKKDFKLVKAGAKNTPVIALIVSTLIIFGLTLIFRDFFDRYLIIVLPLAFLVLSFYKIAKDKYIYFYLISLILLGLFSFIYEYDYLSLNKRMWEVTYNSKEYPMLNPSNTHASFEYNNYFNLDNSYTISNAKELFDRNWLRPKEDSKYLVSYTDVWGYCRLSKVEYKTLMFGFGKKGYFHIMVKGNNPFEPKDCKNIVENIINEK